MRKSNRTRQNHLRVRPEIHSTVEFIDHKESERATRRVFFLSIKFCSCTKERGNRNRGPPHVKQNSFSYKRWWHNLFFFLIGLMMMVPTAKRRKKAPSLLLTKATKEPSSFCNSINDILRKYYFFSCTWRPFLSFFLQGIFPPPLCVSHCRIPCTDENWISHDVHLVRMFKWPNTNFVCTIF